MISPDAPAPERSRSFSARDLAMVATFAGVIAVLGLIPAMYPVGQAVPITAQSLGVMLCGAVLGPRLGTSAVLLFLALVAIGLPLLSGGRGGLGVFATPTVGYLIGFPLAALVIGLFVWAIGAPYRIWWVALGTMLGGVVLLNACGIVGMMWRGDLSFHAALTAAAAFMPGDVIKAAIAAIVAGGVHSAYPGLLPRRTRD